MDTKDLKEAEDSEGQTPIVSESSATTEVATKDCQTSTSEGCKCVNCPTAPILPKLAINILKAWSTMQLSPLQVIQALTNPQSKDHEQLLSMIEAITEQTVQDQDLKLEKKREED